MAKIPRYARTHIPQAVGTLGVDPNAGKEAAFLGEATQALGGILKKQKQIADQATAAKLNRKATVAYTQKVEALKDEFADDPEKMLQEIQTAGEDIYSSAAEGITSPAIRNSFMVRGEGNITTQTVAAVRWSTDQQDNRARSDFTSTRADNVGILGASPDAKTFNSEARSFSIGNRPLYNTIYGKQGAANLQKDLNKGAQDFLQKQTFDDPFTALNTLEAGELDQYLSPDEKNKWLGRAKDGINTFEKNLVTKAKSTTVVRGAELGDKLKAGEVAARDIENEYNLVKDNPNVDDEYKNGLKIWMEKMYAGQEPNVATQLEEYEKFDRMLTELAGVDKKKGLVDKDPDKYFDAVLNYKAQLTKSFNDGKLSKRDFQALYTDALRAVNSTAAEVDGTVTNRSFNVFDNKDVINNKNAYERFDDVLGSGTNRDVMKKLPKGTKGQIGVTMKLNYQTLIKAFKDRKRGKALTSAEYKTAENIAIDAALKEFSDNIFNANLGSVKTGDK